MSKSLNRVQLIGRLGQDPQMRYPTSGVPVTTFSVATNRQWTGKDGTQHDETDWHTVVAWDRLAQICSEHLSRGRLVYIEGRMQTRSWEQDGQTRYKTEVVANDMLILDTKGALAPDDMPVEREESAPVSRSNGSSSGRREQAPAAKPAPSRSPRISVVEPEDDPEDLPF
jgi:single-strand DNA-binding protein